MTGFARHRRSRLLIATFADYEADLLRSLAAQLVELLREDRPAPDASRDPLEALLDFTGPTTEPDDPVLARLLPSAYRDDVEASGEFRRFTEGALRDGKAAASLTVIESLEEAGLPAEPDPAGLTIDLELEEPDAETWLRALTDMRLAIATRLGVEEGDDERWLALPDDDPRAQAHDVYEWLGYLQETLVRALTD